jgi:formylglycine-generating enzyme required for sulfatase activity
MDVVMPKIFICYRREDSEWPAQRIYDELVDHFGSESVVFDIDTIPLGTDFREYLNKEVSRCDIFLAVIGDSWLEILKQRLDEPNDFVRIEIQAALERKVPVVPILVGKKSVPSEKDLPPELADLPYKQAAEVRAGPDLQSHLKRLVNGLEHLFSESKVGKYYTQKQVDKAIEREELTTKYTNSIGMEFVLIPAGDFMMGSKLKPEEVAQKYKDNLEWSKPEHPRHKVTISNPIYLQSTPVTQSHWKEVMGNNPSYFRGCGDYCPVENVSWNDVKIFIKKINEIEETDKYRLPTEAEWEYACRAGTTTEFFFGDDESKLGDYAWYDGNSNKKTHPVGQKEPNAWELYDMHGNVYEWVEDEWHDNYAGAPTDGMAWVGEPRGIIQVFRGGSWSHNAMRCRSANRNGDKHTYRSNLVGFRLAKSVEFGSGSREN